MKKLVFALLCCCPILACGDSAPPDSSGDKQTLTLNAENGTGDFSFCDNDHCETLPNPGGCKTLTITIDTASGKTCETCEAADGSKRKNCGSTSVACEIVTTPDPDCVVCAYINGAVLFSSCTPPPDKCANVVCPAVHSEPCPDGTHSVTDPTGCCGSICVPNVCNMMCPATAQLARICPDGQHAEPEPGSCCGTICVPNACAGVVCPESAFPVCYGGAAAVPDPSNCCGYICPPINCDNVMCASLIACPAGSLQLVDAPTCCGSCVPEICTSDTDCPTNQHCAFTDGACAPCSAPPGAACTDVCRPVGVCEPDAIIDPLP